MRESYFWKTVNLEIAISIRSGDFEVNLLTARAVSAIGSFHPLLIKNDARMEVRNWCTRLFRVGNPGAMERGGIRVPP